MHKRSLLPFLLLLFAVPLLAGAVFAPDPGGNSRIEATSTVSGDAFAAGNNAANRGRVNGDLFIAGGNVSNDGQVGGDILAAGGEVSLGGTVQGDARVAGGNIRVTGEVGRNLTAGSGTLWLAPGARLGHNLVAGGGDVRLEGQVGGDVLVGASTLTITGSIAGNLEAGVDNLQILPDARIGGDLIYTSQRQADIPPGTVAGRVQWKQAPAASSRTATWHKAMLGTRLVGTAGFLLVGLLLALIFPGFWNRAADKLSRQPWPALGYGLAVLFLVPVAAVLLMVTIIGLPAGLLALLLYLPAVYLARLVAGYWLGRRILQRQATVWALLLGNFLLVAISWLPWVGWLVGLASTLLGLGVLWMLFLDSRRRDNAPER